MCTAKFPVQALSANITEFLKKIKSADIRNKIEEGLQNQIKYIDEGTGISNVAEIYTILPGDNDKAEVCLSAAYCQFLWCMTDYVLKTLDYSILELGANSCNLSSKELLDYQKRILNIPFEHLQEMLPTIPTDFLFKFISFLSSIQDFGSPKWLESIKLDETLSDILKNTRGKLDMQMFEGIDIRGHYEERTNAAYCSGVAFILLHEYEHYSQGHLKRNFIAGDEECADSAAYWSLVSDVAENERFTSICGVISVLASFLYLFGLEEDGVHPRADIRIFDFFDNFKNENPKYYLLLFKFIEKWGASYTDYPLGLEGNEESLQKLKEFFKRHHA